jgi:DNA-binding NarL/FixJ family response regulator
MINIMIVDDHKMVRDGFRKILESYTLDSKEDINVVAEAGNGYECMTKLKTYHPNMVLLDINMPDMDGFETLKAIRKKKIYRPNVLMVTMQSDVDCLLQAYDMGADGYILKSCDTKDLFKAIDTVNTGKKFILPSYIPILNSKLITNDIDKEKIKLLTEREMEILKLAASGNINKDISYRLNITERTVKNTLSRIYKKIGCYDRVQASVFCVRNGLVTLQD